MDPIQTANVEILTGAQGPWWVRAAGELFGPYGSYDAAVDELPTIFRELY
jgi:hypothetical protein